MIKMDKLLILLCKLVIWTPFLRAKMCRCGCSCCKFYQTWNAEDWSTWDVHHKVHRKRSWISTINQRRWTANRTVSTRHRTHWWCECSVQWQTSSWRYVSMPCVTSLLFFVDQSFLLYQLFHLTSSEPGSNPAGTYISHCWGQEGHSANIALVHQPKSNLLVMCISALTKESLMLNWDWRFWSLLNWNSRKKGRCRAQEILKSKYWDSYYSKRKIELFSWEYIWVSVIHWTTSNDVFKQFAVHTELISLLFVIIGTSVWMSVSV